MNKRKSVAQESYRPLQNKKCYLDFKTYRPSSHFLNDLRSLGATVEPFFGREIAYVITDRPDYKKASPAQKPNSVDSSGQTMSPPFSNGFLAESPSTSASPCPEVKMSFRMARGQYMLDHVVKPKSGPTDILELCHLWQIKVLFVKNVLMWIQQLKQNSLLPPLKAGKQEGSKGKTKTDAIQKLAAPFIKVEDTSCQYRPLCRSLKRWPDIEIERSLAAVAPPPNLQPDDDKWPIGTVVLKDWFQNCNAMNEHPKAKVAEEKKYNCEICGSSYTYLRKHLLSSSHQLFMQNPSNFATLGQLISTLPYSRPENQSLPLAPLTKLKASDSSAETATPSHPAGNHHGTKGKIESGFRVLLAVKENSNVTTQSAYCGNLSNVKHLRVVRQGVSKGPVNKALERARSIPVKRTRLSKSMSQSTSTATCYEPRKCRSEGCSISPEDYIVLPSVLTEDQNKENVLQSVLPDLVGPVQAADRHLVLSGPTAPVASKSPAQPGGLALQLVTQAHSETELDSSTIEYSWTDVASGFAVDSNSWGAHWNVWSDPDSSFQRWVSTAESSTLPDDTLNGTRQDQMQNQCEGCSFMSGTSSCF